MSTLRNYMSPRAYAPRVSLHDIAGQVVTITDAETRKGVYGDYALMTITLPDESCVIVMTGARYIVEAISAAIDDHALPIRAVFKMRDGHWVAE